MIPLLLCTASIYGAYLSWAVLQERIATTPYDGQVFRSAFILNVAQSIAAVLTGSIYLRLRGQGFKYGNAIWKFMFIAASSSLASPFGYAALKYIDYPTQILGKSCKLVPVMALGIVLYGRRYAGKKYLIVLMVTSGVALFSYKSGGGGNSIYGLFLLSINLLLDGLTNSTQDQMFKQYKLTGPQMMVGMNLISSVYMLIYLSFAQETRTAYSFMVRHPAVIRDILSFAFCGAVGQLAIFYTLEKFGSMVLVTVTLTRKMFTMLLSVVWFKHSLSYLQIFGVILVFSGIALEL